ncbi:protein PAT1 homolog isoform X1 [Primulina huaijiensis]|uniref:protein PAT1 homolog isoform X1 n=1 Tax=Primulina huaijiensis TaxID=1492673 RepID=UPI003CC71D80
MDEYGDGGSIQESSNLQDLEPFTANPTGPAVFDATQYAFFGNNAVEEVELGGLEDDEGDLGAVGFNEEGLQLEREEGDAFGSLSDIDDLSVTFSKLNKTVSGPAGVGGDWGSRESSSATEWAQEGDFSWFDRQALDTETGHGTKNWSSQTYSSARFMESNSLLRTSSHPEQQQQHPHQQQNQHNHFSSEPILIPKSTFTSYPPPGRLQQNSPNGQSSHTNIMHQPGGLQIPLTSSNILPFPNPQLPLNTLTHGSQFGGNMPQMPHGRLQNQWMNQNSPFPGDRSGLPNNILPQPLSNQNGLVPPQIMSHQRSLQTRMHHPFQPAFTQLSGLQPQLFNPHLSVSPPMMNNFEMLGSPDLRDQRAMSMMRSRQGMRYPPQCYDTSGQKVESGWPRFKAKYMSTDEIENVLRLQLAATHSNEPYVDDYYHQACLARKSADAKFRLHFCPTNLSDGPTRARSIAEPHPFLQVDALGRVSFSSIRRPRPLLEVDSSNSSNTVGADSKFTEKPLEQEPMLAARVTIEDGICLLLDVDDIDRFLQFNQLHDGGVLLRQRRHVPLEGLASSLQLVDPLGKNGHTVDLAPKDDFVFLRLVSLPKGRKLLLRYLQLLLPGELTRVVCMAIFRHLRFLFGNVPTDPEAMSSTANLAIAVSSCVRGMELKSLAACLASVVCSVEHTPLRPIGSPTGDGATVVLKSVLDRATELLTDPQAAGNCSMPNRSFWQASFDAFFSLLTKYCFNKYDSVVQSVIQGSPDTPDVGSDVAKAISREMPVELLRASLPHTNEQQRKLLLEFAQRSMPVLGSSSQV